MTQIIMNNEHKRDRNKQTNTGRKKEKDRPQQTPTCSVSQCVKDGGGEKD